MKPPVVSVALALACVVACNSPPPVTAVSVEAPVAIADAGSPPSHLDAADSAPPVAFVDAADASTDLGMIGLLFSPWGGPSGSSKAVWADPSIKKGTTSVNGRLPPEHIMSVIGERAKLRGCYGIGLRKAPALAGAVVLHFTIDRGGAVSQADSTGSTLAAADVLACMVGELKKLQFAQPEGGIVTVTLPLSLTPPAAP